MRKKISRLLILTLFLYSHCTSQTYISLAPSLTNTAGTIGGKSNIALEAGRQWDVFSIGIALGKTTLSPVTGKDTSNYLELRPNLNIFQVGKFTNTFTPGIGYVFNAKENLLTELTYGIEYSLSEKVHINAFFGQYFYSGKETSSSVSFFGISIVLFFRPNKSAPLLKQK
jgi:hypothetical protein